MNSRMVLKFLAIATTVIGMANAQPLSKEAFRLPPRVGILGSVPLSMEDAIAQALANNPDIRNARIDRSIAQFNITAAKGVFDPRLNAESYYEKAVTPVSSSIGGSDSGKLTQKDFSVAPNVTGLLPWGGGDYRVAVSSRKITSDNSFLTLNPQFPTAITAAVTQPLWRGLLYDENRRRIDVEVQNRLLTEEQFRERVMDITAQTEKAFWELLFAVRNLEVLTQGAELARLQLESNRRMAAQDVLAPIDVIEAENQFAVLQQNAFRAQEGLSRAENALKALMLPTRSSPLWAMALIPEAPPPPNTLTGILEEATGDALAKRPELAQARISEDISRTNTRLSREQVKPEVNFVGSYTSSGLAGTELVTQSNPFTGGLDGLFQRINDLSLLQGLPALPPISIGGSGGGVPPILVGGYGQSFANLANRRFPTFRVGVQISLPIRNRTAEANLGKSLAEERQAENRRELVELQVEANVRSTIQGVESSKSALSAATAARDSAEEQYASEVRQFQAGTSTVFLVFQRQTAMINARNAELRAQSDLGSAVSDFERATGRTLSAHNIQID